ncbi:MAG TPA: hypothetical protein K8V62_11955, partial [Corynebacterium variabile]|nr:hypothetical protein [Corynebacterium variabile]
KCLEQLYFELEQMKVTELTLESRLAVQDRRDTLHLVAMQDRGLARELHLQHLRGGEDPVLWVPDIMLGALNATHYDVHEYWNALRDQIVLNKRTPESS